MHCILPHFRAQHTMPGMTHALPPGMTQSTESRHSSLQLHVVVCPLSFHYRPQTSTNSSDRRLLQQLTTLPRQSNYRTTPGSRWQVTTEVYNRPTHCQLPDLCWLITCLGRPLDCWASSYSAAWSSSSIANDSRSSRIQIMAWSVHCIRTWQASCLIW